MLVVLNVNPMTYLELRIFLFLVIILYLACCKPNVVNLDTKNELESRRAEGSTGKKMCVKSDETVKGMLLSDNNFTVLERNCKEISSRHKSCLLRPDTGPCRADILSWYFDAKAGRCFRFYWGGCQGNGNRYVSRQDCINYCYLNNTIAEPRIPYFCSLAFDYGTCFGQYHRWGWDSLFKTCKRRLYSGCGGNQNNFETRDECFATCILGPNNTMNRFNTFTTCIPFTLPDSD